MNPKITLIDIEQKRNPISALYISIDLTKPIP